MESAIANPYVYISAPLHGRGESTSPNVHYAVKCGIRVREAGYVPFIPHLYWLADVIVPKSEDFWLGLDKAWLEVCGALIREEGGSFGADMEEEWANTLDIPVWHGVDSFLRTRPVILGWPGDGLDSNDLHHLGKIK